MTLMIEIPADVERRIREHAADGSVDAIRRLLMDALGPTIDALVRANAPLKPSDDEFERLADQLADEFAQCVGPDCPPLSDFATSREGLYEDHL